MKKLLFMFSLMLAFVAVKAQVATNIQSLISDTVHKAGLDTVINTGVKIQKIQIPGYNDVLTFQGILNKISGTAGGSIVLQGSLDGINYINIGSAFTPTNVALQTFSFSLNPSTWLNYQIQYTGTGTMSVTINSFAMWRKQGYSQGNPK